MENHTPLRNTYRNLKSEYLNKIVQYVHEFGASVLHLRCNFLLRLLVTAATGGGLPNIVVFRKKERYSKVVKSTDNLSA